MIQPLQDRRDAVKISQRELSRRTGIAQARLSRIEAGELELGAGEARLVELALDGREPATQVPTIVPPPAEPERAHEPKPGRRAYVCMTCEPPNRVFLAPGEPEPECRHHGRMLRQANRPYRGQAVPA